MIWRYRISTTARVLGVLIVLGVAVFPLYWMLVTSLTSTKNLFATHVQFWPDLSRAGIYGDTLADNRVGLWLLNSLLLSVGTCALTLVLGVPLGYALSRFAFRGKAAVGALLLLTQALPEALLVVPLFGILHGANLLNSLFGVVLVDTAFVLPVVALVLKGAFDGIPRELDEAARVDGCRPLSTLVRINLPLAAPSVAAAAVIAFFSAWNEYVFAVTFLFDPTKQPASVGLAGFVGENVTPLDTVMTVGIMYTAPAVIFYLFVQKYVVSGMTAGGLKG